MPPVAKKSKKAFPVAKAKPADSDDKLAISGQLDKKLKKAQARLDRQRGVVAIKHLPHGFFEEQLKNYFEQFGKVTRLRLARSKRTGGSKGFAFVEFEYPEVAKVAAETMDNYLMFQRVVKAAYIPPERQRHNYFRSSVRKVVNKVGKPIYVSAVTAAVQNKANYQNNWTDEAYQKRIAANLRKLKKLKAKYGHLGIDFDNLTVKPNIQTTAEGAALQSPEKKPVADKEPGSLLLVRKRKPSPEKKRETLPKKSKEDKPKKKIDLKALLEDTIQEEGPSDDEDFIPTPEVDDDVTTSDEESYGVHLGSDTDDRSEESDKEESPPKRKVVKSYEKSSNVDRITALIKRKPHSGGIQKVVKKPLKEKTKPPSKAAVQNKKAKNVLLAAAVNEINKKDNLKKFKKAAPKKTGKKQRV